jgi:hypothetical protein
MLKTVRSLPSFGGTMIALLMVSSTAAARAEIRQRACAIHVGRNQQVTNGERFQSSWYMEPVIDANPSDSSNLVVAAMENTNQNNWVTYFTSRDSGRTWSRRGGFGGSDPAVAFSGNGRVSVNANSYRRNLIFNSDDAGDSWTGDTVYPSIRDAAGRIISFDMPDLSYSPDHSLLMYGMAGYPVNPGVFPMIALATLRPDGSTNVTTIVSEEGIRESLGPGAMQSPVRQPFTHVLLQRASDIMREPNQTIYVTFYSSPVNAALNIHGGTEFWISQSSDNGTTFSPPRRLARRDGSPLIQRMYGRTAWGMDPAFGRYGGRLYAVWQETVEEGQENVQSGDFALSEPAIVRIMIANSNDFGRTWNEPRVLEDNVVATTEGVNPSLAVNGDGTILVSWYRTLGHANMYRLEGLSFARIATASTDGGNTFIRPVQVSSVPTQNFRASNRSYSEAIVGWGRVLGHFNKTVADRRGTFHEVWQDGRTGRMEIWYAAIDVRCSN